jgi:hypothetical protein
MPTGCGRRRPLSELRRCARRGHRSAMFLPTLNTYLADGIQLLYRSLLVEFDPHNAKVLGFLRNSSGATGVRTRKPLTT